MFSFFASEPRVFRHRPVLVTTLLYTGVAHFSLQLPVVVTACVCVPLLFMDCAMATANLGKFFVSGPVQLSYPSNTEYLLQTASSIGASAFPPG